MEKAKKILIPAVIALILIGGSIGGYFIYESINYFKTNNASVSANMVNVMPLLSGTISSWEVREGEDVKQGQLLGKQDLSSMVNSSKIDQNALENSADSILSKAEIKAPIDGKIVQSNVIKGVTASAGSTVAVVADTSDLFIKANVEETDIFKIKEGQRVKIKIDAYPGKNFTGYVESIGAATQNAFSQYASLNTSGTYSKVTQLIPVRITLINDEELPMVIGMNATVKISIK
ncbi:HlyD family secretion protein [Sinanaerobacter chloroacetimidivorans]|nr:efflux RND transporter periplasmic adaptor subunit [Sinanaerobacter chloroacetimidivorans]